MQLFCVSCKFRAFAPIPGIFEIILKISAFKLALGEVKIYPSAVYTVGNEMKTGQLYKQANQLAHTLCAANMYVCIYR